MTGTPDSMMCAIRSSWPGLALDLDGIRPRLHEFLHRVHGEGGALAHRQERHVAHHELVGGTAPHRPHMQGHHLDGGVHRAVEAVHDHRETVAHEQGVDLGAVENPRRPAVVAGDHGDGMVGSLALAEIQYVHAGSPLSAKRQGLSAAESGRRFRYLSFIGSSPRHYDAVGVPSRHRSPFSGENRSRGAEY